jgi:hypothetical protein
VLGVDTTAMVMEQRYTNAKVVIGRQVFSMTKQVKVFILFYAFLNVCWNKHSCFVFDCSCFVAEHYFYETAAFQRRAEEAAKPIVYVDFTPAMAAKYMKVRKVVPESSVRDNMRVDCIRQEDIDRFFNENPMESLPPLTCNPSATLKPVAGTGTDTDTTKQDPTRRKSL